MMEDTEQLEEFLTPEEYREQAIHRGISILVTIMLILAVLLCMYVVIQVLSNGYANIGGFMMFRVVTGSMEPTIPTGALMVTREVPITSIRLNDIICFRTQEAAIWGKIVTHRVVEVLRTVDGAVMFRTQGDANLVADGYLVDQGNFVGKVIWHTGDDSVVAGIFSFFTNKVGFLGCIVFPCLLFAGMVLKECVNNIRAELHDTLRQLEEPEQAPDWESDPLCGMTQEEYNEMYERIRAELMEELMQIVQISQEQ